MYLKTTGLKHGMKLLLWCSHIDRKDQRWPWMLQTGGWQGQVSRSDWAEQRRHWWWYSLQNTVKIHVHWFSTSGFHIFVIMFDDRFLKVWNIKYIMQCIQYIQNNSCTVTNTLVYFISSLWNIYIELHFLGFIYFMIFCIWKLIKQW